MRAENDHALTFHPQRGLSTGGRSLLDAVARRSVLALLGMLERGCVTVVEADESIAFGRPGDGPSVTVTVRDRATYRAMLFGGSVGAGEAYMKGHWTCDDLPSLARLLARNVSTLDAMETGPARLARRAGERVTAIARRNTRGAAAGILRSTTTCRATSSASSSTSR